MSNHVHDIIVIGASAGGVKALSALVSDLPADLPAAVFIAMHVPPWRASDLPDILSRSGPLPAVHPQSGDSFAHGLIYVAPPDYHLLLNHDNRIELWRGPKENGFRPSINALFRSAAVAYGPRVVGVVLTGYMDDGATGLWWIKRNHGVAVVQDPHEADFPEMPHNALGHVPADYVAQLREIPPILTALARGLPRSSRRRDQEMAR